MEVGGGRGVARGVGAFGALLFDGHIQNNHTVLYRIMGCSHWPGGPLEPPTHQLGGGGPPYGTDRDCRCFSQIIDTVGQGENLF